MGYGLVNVGQSTKPVSDDLIEHIADKNNPHEVTAAQVGAIPTSEAGAPGGVAQLGEDGLVLPSQLPAGGGFIEFSGALTDRDPNTLYGLVLADFGGGN